MKTRYYQTNGRRYLVKQIKSKEYLAFHKHNQKIEAMQRSYDLAVMFNKLEKIIGKKIGFKLQYDKEWEYIEK